MDAAWNGHLECVKILAPLDNGMKDNTGWTALVFAAARGHLECAKELASLEARIQDEYN